MSGLMHNELQAQGITSTRGRGRKYIDRLAGKAEAATHRQVSLPLGGEESVRGMGLQAVDFSRGRSFSGLSPHDVELLVRAELSKPGNTDNRKRRRRWGRSTGSVPTIGAVEHAMWLFAEAMQHFAHDARDIAVIKIRYAMFLHVYTADVNLANQALESAARSSELSWEDQYEVFSRLRGLETKRRSQNVGYDSVQAVASEEFGRRLRRALYSHDRALQAKTQLVTLIHKRRADLLTSSTLSERLGSRLESMSRWAQLANRQYTALNATNTEFLGLAKVCERFALDVLHDPVAAAKYHERAAEFDALHPDSELGVSRQAKLPLLTPKPTASNIARIDTQFQFGSLLMILVSFGECTRCGRQLLRPFVSTLFSSIFVVVFVFRVLGGRCARLLPSVCVCLFVCCLSM